MKFLWLYVTYPHKEAALKAARLLVKDRYVACANILNQATAVYEWEGEVQECEECVLVAKTTTEAYHLVEKTIKEHHPYTLPCIIALPVERGLEEYLKWVGDKVGGRNK